LGGLFGASGATVIALDATVFGVSEEEAVDTGCAVFDICSGTRSTGLITTFTLTSFLVSKGTFRTFQHAHTIFNKQSSQTLGTQVVTTKLTVIFTSFTSISISDLITIVAYRTE
jgi:hypothetical protein